MNKNREKMERLPLEYPTREALKIYLRRLLLISAVIGANFVLLGIFLLILKLPVVDPRLSLLFLTTLAAAIACAVYFATLYYKRGAVISLRNPLGQVEISQRAISDFIQREGREVEGVGDLKAKVRSTGEGVDVELSLSAQAEGEIPRLIDELQSVVKKYLNSTVGIENVKEIKVKVTKII